MVYMSNHGRCERVDYRKGLRRWLEIRYYNADGILILTKKGPSITFRPDYYRLEKIMDILMLIGVWISSSVFGVFVTWCILEGF